jgi:hypothetical protein
MAARRDTKKWGPKWGPTSALALEEGHALLLRINGDPSQNASAETDGQPIPSRLQVGIQDHLRGW